MKISLEVDVIFYSVVFIIELIYCLYLVVVFELCL